jgi:cytochrome P450
MTSEQPTRGDGDEQSETMVGGAGVPEVDFDHQGSEYAVSGPEMLARLRSDCPVAHSPHHGGFYIASRHNDVARFARDDDAFSSEWTEGGPQKGISVPPTVIRWGFIMMDPPRSLQLRRAIMPMLTLSAVRSYEQGWRTRVNEAIDEFVERGRCDIVTEYTDRIPAVLTMDLLGLAPDDWKLYVEFFHHNTADRIADERYAEIQGAGNWVFAKIAEEIEERRARPREDGLTWFINQKIDGEPIPEHELIENVALLMIGGFDTTSTLLANTFIYLSDHPEERRRLREDPSLLDGACEEFLRYFSPIQNLARTVMRDVEVEGGCMRTGGRVLLSWASANRDSAVFERPDEVDIERFPNRHLAFGVGTHRCAGMHAARADFRLAVGEFLRRIPDFEVDVDKGRRYASRGINNGWHSLPMTFAVGPRELDVQAAA